LLTNKAVSWPSGHRVRPHSTPSGTAAAQAVATKATAAKAIPMDDDKSDSEDDIKEFNS